MSQDVLVVVEHLDGKIADITFEMLAMAKDAASQTGGAVVAAMIGGNDDIAGQLGAASKLYKIDGAGLENFNPESHAASVKAAMDAASPRITMVGHTSTGMDLASGLSTKGKIPLAASVISVESGSETKAVGQLYGGKMNVTSYLGDGPCIVSIAAGAASADAGKVDGAPAVEVVAAPATDGRVTFKQLIPPEAGDVDITTQDILVAIGRGIGNEDGVETAQELAEALDAAVAASRPIIDAGWLPKSRQVGKSGLKVTPKVYLALGISGAPEHLEGMKGAATIVAVNTDKNAPIFSVADYGLVGDLYEVCEELTEALEDR